MSLAFRSLLIACAAAMAGAGTVMAQGFPAKPIHMVVAFAPGGAVDSVARKLAQSLGDRLGQQIVVDNRSGASGAIGSDFVAKAPADGYTLLFAPSTLLANPLVMQTKQNFDLHRDLTPIAMVASGPMLLLVPPNGPTSVAEFVKEAKAKPEQFNFGTGGYGSAPHLSEANFKLRAGIDAVPILLYRGTAPAMTDLIGGRLSAMMEPMLSAIPQVRGGTVRALAITGRKRDALFPDVPTFEEAGYTDMVFSTWYGVWAPAALPEPVKQKLVEAQLAVLGSAEFTGWLRQQGYESTPLAGQHFVDFLNAEEKRYERIVRDGNIQPQ